MPAKPYNIPLPAIPDSTWMKNVTQTFIHGIPFDDRHLCLVDDKKFPETGESAQLSHLRRFVEQRLTQLAVREYSLWMNGRLPFISPRELQLWRLRQFVQYIWIWNLPDDEDLSLIFNTTRKKAANLAADFSARFRKSVLFPIALRRLFVILLRPPFEPDMEHGRMMGAHYRVPSVRSVDDTNLLITEIKQRTRKMLANANPHPRDPTVMWVSDELVNLLKDEKLRQAIEEAYPLPDQAGNEG
ncbi:MAG: hypothetical protein V4773_30950 [Verrucomicrobiota bacterium]